MEQWRPDFRPIPEKLAERIKRYGAAKGGITPGDWQSLLRSCQKADEDYPGHNLETTLRRVAKKRGVVLG